MTQATVNRSASLTNEYPIAPAWFKTERLGPNLHCITEPHVHELERANMFLVEGSERDMIIDTGMGVVPLKPCLDQLRTQPQKELICVSSHTHIDHIGGVHEFDTRLVHPAEADNMSNPAGITSLFCEDLPPSLVQTFLDAGYPPLGELMIDAYPHIDYDPQSYRLRGAAATGLLIENDKIDLGNICYEVLHLPGHSPGSIGLYETATGVLFGADAIYDGPLIYQGPGMSIEDYIATFRKLQTLDVTLVHGGHDPSFSPARMQEIIEDYMRRWQA